MTVMEVRSVVPALLVAHRQVFVVAQRGCAPGCLSNHNGCPTPVMMPTPRSGFVHEHLVTLGTFVQLPYVLPPVTTTFDHVQDEQDPEPQVMTTSYPLLDTAPLPETFLMVRSVIGTPLLAVPPSRSPPS